MNVFAIKVMTVNKKQPLHQCTVLYLEGRIYIEIPVLHVEHVIDFTSSGIMTEYIQIVVMLLYFKN